VKGEAVRAVGAETSSQAPMAAVRDKVLILDFGAQYTQLIARRVRESNVYCEIHPGDVSDGFIREFAPRGIILSGSHMSAYENSTDKAPAAVFAQGVPVLGICYGMQTMAQQLGGRVEPGNVRELRNFALRLVLGLNEDGSAHVHTIPAPPLAELMSRFEKEIIVQQLRRQRGNIAAASEALAIPKTTLYDKLQKHGISPIVFRCGEPDRHCRAGTRLSKTGTTQDDMSDHKLD